MKKILICFLLLGAFTVSAQEKIPAGKSGIETKKSSLKQAELIKQLNLDENQLQNLNSTLEARRNMLSKPGMTQEQINSIESGIKKKIEHILNDKQREIYNSSNITLQ